MANGAGSPGIWPADMIRAAAEPQLTAAHTAVIYFHGMGSQRRLEETSRIVDSLDAYGHKNNLKLSGVNCHVEPSRVTPGETVQFIRTVHRHGADGSGSSPANPRAMSQVHFFEGYWAPITAEGVQPWTVFWWLLDQAKRPFVVLRSNWRTHARLRRSALRELQELHLRLGKALRFSERLQRILWGPNLPRRQAIVRLKPTDVQTLLKEYKAFEGPEARRNYPAGTFAEFRKYLGERLDGRTPRQAWRRGRLQRAADAWNNHAFDIEIRNLAVLWTMLLFVGLSMLTGVVLAGRFLGWIQHTTIVSGATDWASTSLSMVSSLFHLTPLTLLGLLVTLVGLPVFLSRFLGDVVYWCTYEETDVRFKKRREILDFGVKVVKHVLKDPLCKRVVVLSHSLGTAVAHDILLELGKEDWARTHNRPGFDLVSTEELNKIEHFVTAASPIDKIHYFFESDPGPSHRYTRVTDTTRGDMGRKPFGNNNNRPFLHWINFWDKADIISGSLESPPNATDIHVLVDNVEVSNGTLLPSTAHTTYFDNLTVQQVLFDIIYKNEYSYRVIDDRASPGADNRHYVSQKVGPGRGKNATRLIQGLIMSLPWITLVYLVYFLCRGLSTVVVK